MQKLYVTVPFLLCFIISYLRAVSKYKPPGLIFGGAINGGFFALVTSLGVLYLFGDYTWRGLFSEFYGV